MDDTLSSVLIEHLQKPKYRKVLICSPDVEEAIRKILSGPSGNLAPIGTPMMFGIDIVVAGDSAPGTWRLVQHDHCEVGWPESEWTKIGYTDSGGIIYTAPIDSDRGTVSHANCTILATSEGDSDVRT